MRGMRGGGGGRRYEAKKRAVILSILREFVKLKRSIRVEEGTRRDSRTWFKSDLLLSLGAERRRRAHTRTHIFLYHEYKDHYMRMEFLAFQEMRARKTH